MKKQGKIILIISAALAVVIAGMIFVLNKVVPTGGDTHDLASGTEQAALSLPRSADTETSDASDTPEPVTSSAEIIGTEPSGESAAPTETVTASDLTTVSEDAPLIPSETKETEEPVQPSVEWDPYRFLTSNDPLHKIEITLDGYIITAVGRYEGCALYDMILNPDHSDGDNGDPFSRLKNEPDIKENGDGSFEAVLYNSALEKEPSGFCTLLLVLVDNETLETYLPTYRLELSEDGLRFPDVMEVIENNSLIASTPLELPETGVREYICAGGSDEDIRNTLAEVKALSDEICSGITDEYEKLRAIASWVSENIYYDFDARDTEVKDETVCLSHLLETHRSVCIGFTNLFTALCAAQDIECYNIRGSASTGASYAEENAEYELHEWAYAVIDGRRVWVDVVWNTWNTYSHGKYNKEKTYYKYFDITEQVYALDHWARSCEHRDYFGLLQ